MKRRRKTWRKLGSKGKEEGESGRRREKEREEGEMREYMDGKTEKMWYRTRGKDFSR